MRQGRDAGKNSPWNLGIPWRTESGEYGSLGGDPGLRFGGGQLRRPLPIGLRPESSRSRDYSTTRF